MKKLVEKSEEASSYMTEEDILQEIANLKIRGAQDIVLKMVHGWRDAELSWTYSTIETDEEYEERLAREEAERKQKEAYTKKKQAAILKKREKDRALYERLKKEFER